jgi:hypothetical protein
MELLQGGVERSVIALWLGHESIETTQMYLDADLALKDKALAKMTPMANGKAAGRYRPDDNRPESRPSTGYPCRLCRRSGSDLFQRRQGKEVSGSAIRRRQGSDLRHGSRRSERRWMARMSWWHDPTRPALSCSTAHPGNEQNLAPSACQRAFQRTLP